MNDAESPLSCTIRPTKYLSIGESMFHSGCGVIEILFPNMRPIDIEKISFVNNYTAALSIKMKIAKSASNQTGHTWVTGLKNYQLMPKPHCETGSQSYFHLMSSDFCKQPNEVCALRFILRQPSPNWKTFTLEEIYVHAKKTKDPTNENPKWLESVENLSASEMKPRDQAELKGLPDTEQVSEKMQEILQLAEKTVLSAPNVELGRFDIDGSYEINLLSYT
uniref:Nicolin-1 n=1 Tax=Phallusia mammillata TaxID=59560 RepID=A0A6F9DN36_9ASCI|nr:nicolin-1 [Phallusia mammillata]